MMAIVLDGETKVTNSRQIYGKYQAWFMTVFTFINVLTIGIAVILLLNAIQKKPESEQLHSIEAYEDVVLTEMNNRIFELEQKFEALSVNATAFRINLEDQLTKMAQNSSTERSEDSLMAKSETGEKHRDSKDAVGEVGAIPEDIKNELDVIKYELMRIMKVVEDMKKDYRAEINESSNSLKASIVELKNVTFANTDTIYVLINELVAKCNWLQEKMGL